MDQNVAQAGGLLNCPHCHLLQEVTGDAQDGTHQIVCIGCEKMFNYAIREGMLKDWTPPTIAGIVYKGAGKAGGV